MTKNFLRISISFAILGFGATCFASALPPGSYLETCSNCRVSIIKGKNVLTCKSNSFQHCQGKPSDLVGGCCGKGKARTASLTLDPNRKHIGIENFRGELRYVK